MGKAQNRTGMTGSGFQGTSELIQIEVHRRPSIQKLLDISIA